MKKKQEKNGIGMERYEKSHAKRMATVVASEARRKMVAQAAAKRMRADYGI